MELLIKLGFLSSSCAKPIVMLYNFTRAFFYLYSIRKRLSFSIASCFSHKLFSIYLLYTNSLSFARRFRQGGSRLSYHLFIRRILIMYRVALIFLPRHNPEKRCGGFFTVRGASGTHESRLFGLGTMQCVCLHSRPIEFFRHPMISDSTGMCIAL